MKKFLIVLLLLVTMMVPLSAAAQPMDEYMGPMESIEAVYDALITDQDLEGAMALFADDAVLTIIPGPRGSDGIFAGKEAIRGRIVPSLATSKSRETAPPFHSASGPLAWSSEAPPPMCLMGPA